MNFIFAHQQSVPDRKLTDGLLNWDLSFDNYEREIPRLLWFSRGYWLCWPFHGRVWLLFSLLSSYRLFIRADEEEEKALRTEKKEERNLRKYATDFSFLLARSPLHQKFNALKYVSSHSSFDNRSRLLSSRMSHGRWTWNDYLTYLLLTLVFLSSWTDINGIFAELPQIVLTQPEKWRLGAHLALVTNLGNLAPLTLVLIRCLHPKQRLNPVPINYVVILIGMLSCFLLIFFWQHTSIIRNQPHSTALLLLALFLSLLDCTSSVSFADYLQRFRKQFTSALFLGESLTSILPSLLAIAQGNGKIICIPSTNGSNTTEEIYQTARFSVSTYFFSLFILLSISFVAFALLQWTSIARDARQPAAKESLKSTREPTDTSDTLVEHPRLSTSEPLPLTRTGYLLLSFGCTYTSSILFGMLLAISTYVLMPYGHQIFYLGTILSPWMFTLVWILGMFKPIISKRVILLLILLGSMAFIFDLIVALKSPCPPWVNTTYGNVLVLFVWLITYVLLGYPRLVIANYVRAYSPNGMFWYGVNVQLGALLGSITAYLLVETFSIFYQRRSCEEPRC